MTPAEHIRNLADRIERGLPRVELGHTLIQWVNENRNKADDRQVYLDCQTIILNYPKDFTLPAEKAYD